MKASDSEDIDSLVVERCAVGVEAVELFFLLDNVLVDAHSDMFGQFAVGRAIERLHIPSRVLLRLARLCAFALHHFLGFL